MGYGTSLGTAHEDEMSYVLEKGLTDKQSADQKEMATNEQSGDFQSRFYATDASTMPLEASRKLTDALKQIGGTQVPEKVLETNYVDSLKSGNDKTMDFLFGKGENDIRPALGHLAETVKNAFALPGDVYSGKVQAGSVQEIERAADLASLMVMGPAPVAAKLADGSLGSFAGVKSKSLPKDKLYEAQNMELDMIHPDEIWDKTGFFRGADQRWRYEISDNQAKLKPEAFDTIKEVEGKGDTWTPQGDKIVPKSTVPNVRNLKSIEDWTSFIVGGPRKPLTLDKVIDHPELFKAYPELKTMKVEPLPEYAKKAGIQGQISGDTIYLNEGHPEYIKGVLLHEIQHGIQHHEGFAFGGNPKQFLPKELSQAEKEFLAIKKSEEPKIEQELNEKPLVFAFGNKVWSAKNYIRAEQNGTLTEASRSVLDRLKTEKPEAYRKLSNIVKSERLIQQAKDEAYTKYTKLMGEVEARNVQGRRNTSEFMRAQLPPYRTEDFPRHLQTNPN